MKQWINALHKLFDPQLKSPTAEQFSLKHPEALPEKPPDLTVQTAVQAPGLDPLARLQARTDTGMIEVSRALDLLGSDFTPDLGLTMGRMRQALRSAHNPDVIFRELTLPFSPPLKACLVFIDGVVDANEVDLSVLAPLMSLPRVSERTTGIDILGQVEATLMPSRAVLKVFTLSEAVGRVCSGECVLLLESAPGCLSVDLRKWPGRPVEQPSNEQTVRGPQEAFTETLRVNTALLRRQLMIPELVLEPAKIGRRSRTDVCIAYLDGVVNPHLVAEVRRRLSVLDMDLVDDSGTLEQLLEDSPMAFLPTLAATQRPDRAAALLTEGRVILLVDCSPYAIIAPTVFGDFFRNPEDYYIKWPYGTFLRTIRIVGMLITLLLPSLYIAIANFHPEMIPSGLLLAIAASREQVPFPAPIEVLFMEVAFEVIREGSLRIPAAMGQTVGIVGALILGQAAVQASIVSPILVIVVSTTALGSFTIPDYSMSLTVRLFRFGFVGLAASFGLFGVAAGLFFVSIHAASLRSFGVPYMAPWGPHSKSSPDGIVRGRLAAMEQRPEMLRTKDSRRQTRGLVAWNPFNHEPRR